MKRTRTCDACRQGRAEAFTLIELLIVVAIIALLVTILLPAFNRIRLMAKSAATQTFVEALNDGAELYHSDYKLYPGQDRDSREKLASGGASGSMTGTMLMAQRLFGIDENGRVVSKTYASYKEETLVDIHIGGDTGTAGRNSVVDSFGGIEKPLLYFPARPELKQQYVFSDNSYYFQDPGISEDVLPKDAKDSFETFVKTDTQGPLRGRPYRDGEFLIIGPGIDRVYFTGDDNKNFVR